MRFTLALLFFLLGLAVAVPVAEPANNKAPATKAAPAKTPAKAPTKAPANSSDKKKLVKGINDNIKAGGKEIKSTNDAEKAAKKGDAKGLKKDEKKIGQALSEATKAREKNQKIAGNKDKKLTEGLNKVENAQKGAKKTVDSFTGNPKKDQPKLDSLGKTFAKGKKTNQENLKEAKKNFN
ncbi:hypothetical protein Cob_v011744 [Colletotrichum orbiculare MAFF 240422]|uniref:Lea domain protein n=1 Tax=Colletotrichum orbiculare (strain 104-T / ATCC 96160 / CBS 514.97 / LARS 414 / MAFF 240422) TaxID=1213857 RepID=N4V706_COLOR|nr:hypothetical protein Cob_v011744 [Colletotrichum orbiculare MAFF 240422]